MKSDDWKKAVDLVRIGGQAGGGNQGPVGGVGHDFAGGEELPAGEKMVGGGGGDHTGVGALC